MTTAKDFLYQQFMDDPDIIPPEGKTKEELVEELVDQKLRQSRNNSRAFELLSKDAGGGYDIATYSWDKSTKKVQEPWVDEKELEKAVPDKYGEPTKGQLKLLHRPFKVLTGSLDDFELEPPPENDSETTQRELKFVRTAAKFAEENPERFEGIDVEDRNLLTPFLDFLASENLSVDEEYLKNVLSDVATIAMYWKFKYNRPRPYQYKGMTERKNESADTPSYPSGHSLQAKVAADILSNAYPEHAEELQYIGKNIGRNRIMGGWHFPSDHAAGRDLADQIIEKLPKNVDMFLKKSPLGEDDYMAAIRSSMQKHAEDFNIPVQKNKQDVPREVTLEQRTQFTIQFVRELLESKKYNVSNKKILETSKRIVEASGEDYGKWADQLVRLHHSTPEEDIGLEASPEDRNFQGVSQEQADATKTLINKVKKKGPLKGFKHPDLGPVLQFITPRAKPDGSASRAAGTQTSSTPKAPQEPKAKADSQPKTPVAETTPQPETAKEPAAKKPNTEETENTASSESDQTTTADEAPDTESANQEASSSNASTSDQEEPTEEEQPQEETDQKDDAEDEPKAQAETSEESTETAGTTPPSFRQRRLDVLTDEYGDDVLDQLINEEHPSYENREAVRNTLLSEEKHTDDSFAKIVAQVRAKAAAEDKAAQEAKAPSTGYKASAKEVEEIRRRLRMDDIKDVVDKHVAEHVRRFGNKGDYTTVNGLARHIAEMPRDKSMKQIGSFYDQADKLREKTEREEAATQRREAAQKEEDEKTQRVADFNSELEALPEVTRTSTQHDMEEALRAAEVFENKHKDTLSDPKNSKLKTSFDKHKNAQKKNIQRWASPKVAAETEETIKSEREEHGADFGGAAHRSKIEDAKTASEAKHVEHQTFLNTVGNQRMKHSVFANRDDHQQTSTFTANDQTEIDEARSKGKTDAEIKQDRISRGLPPGSPPRPGLEWHKETHRWINPDVYKDVGNVLKAGESVHIADPAAIGLAHHVDTTPDGGILAHKDENGNLNIYSPSAAKTNKFGHHAPDHENQPHLPSEEQHARSNAAAHLVSSGKVSMSSAELTEKLGVARATSALETWYREGQGQLYGKYLRGAIGGAAVGALAGPAGAVVGAALGGGLAYAGIKNRKDFTRDAIADKMISELGSKATDATLTAVDQFRAGSVGAPNPLKGSVGKLTSFVRNRGSSDGED